MSNTVKIIAGVIVTPKHHQALLDEFGELFIEKLFDEGKVFYLEKDTYIIGYTVNDNILVHGFRMIGAGVCFEHVIKVNKFIGTIDNRLSRTLAEVEGDARNGIWIINA